ncbi:MAG: hypothetical protein A3C38_02485 [Planctomycetes bacterium RIFCSPHIGHO2_02_FULL_50_42]|uniref:hypothetical protein n=1 Tax=Candidatus Avalokitesvara rifleensis TaxID=3367620 RepID=UPI0008CC4564|nr:hypothetical protein [Candidatus Brocadiales bacterium]OHB37172.1 MAG: hypothetical protein A2060_06885 [Planctomycetes bacterium GWA2_50_13]OHB88175.1 MAG: hypothetical protein A3C38_02485 [Planctomycetes bacterium RIFCSPHIGHO2_02_FULL_50_42]OHB91612.1 MAG: hypothetical protein A3E75_00110 [Planctomycetes bacterium RIFCSPHIGHO2_12_FULL_51_37]OHB95724.1 MAG: hypothetical protein A3I59_06850 [Planctomycetes bacterium RIFCSPLOWO2_02_FULL_50_16]OHC02952.1 MAG: hypothetical protein A3G17_07470 
MALLNKITLISTLAIFLLSLSLNVSSALAIPPGNPFNSLSEEDKGRIVKILQDISKKKDQPTRETFREFWIIWEKQGRWPEADIQDLRDYLVGPSLIYMTYVWQDALNSLQTSTPQKNAERAKYEKRLLALGIIKKEEIEKNDKMIEKISHQEPLATEDGREYVVTEAGIELVLTSLLDADKRVQRLFSKEYIEPPQQ